MRFSIAALLFALPAIVSAVPSHSYDARFAALTVKHARVAQRMANPLAERTELSVRQTACTTQCSSSTDSSAVTAYNKCGDNDVVCICNALESMSSACLACVLPAIGLTASELNTACGSGSTTTQCDSQCSSSGDVAANTAAGECTTSSLSDPCVCAALGEMSTTCRSCLLQASGITSSQYTQECAASGTNSSTAVGSTPTGTSSSCATSCSSASDQSALNTGAQCAETDTTCQCNALAQLSSGCLTCELNAVGLTQSQYQAACSGGAGGSPSYSFVGGTPTSSASSSSPTSGSGANGFTVASCNPSCSSTADQTAITQGNACSATDVSCACTAFAAMDSTCRSCILSANGLSQTDLNSQCAAASSQSSASSTAGPGASTLPNSQQPTSGVVAGFSIGLKEVMGVAAVALGAVIFV
ncbi:hypothetical protein CALCODRAFT_516416 [Calocera cornea HHB12733]|uniref:Extracellular membrane protein CFEM domain-containing protein n=1 Tax=Calocera cornea HHB12733 TaxID=1353952 RepID=A0A165H916_9BASI|nr:hypothetical protein CALCODRAFT_516416 [Calocera cornea HHB12733]